MKKHEINKIMELRRLGIGYKSIAQAMGISRDSVRYQCKIHGLDGDGLKDFNKWCEEPKLKQFCRNCGIKINENHKMGRRRTYCSTKCKREWEGQHPTFYYHVCYYCGKEFKSKAAQANFCSNKCYVRDRFWREEDLENVVSLIKDGKPVPNAPGWIKNLVMGKEDVAPEIIRK